MERIEERMPPLVVVKVPVWAPALLVAPGATVMVAAAVPVGATWAICELCLVYCDVELMLRSCTYALRNDRTGVEATANATNAIGGLLSLLTRQTAEICLRRSR